MKLAALQRAVARAIMQPLTPSERMSRTAPGGGRMSAYAARYIKPNDRLSSCERLEIYNQQYWFRVLGSMAEDFPGLRAVLGARRFVDMCRAYLVDCPSRSFTLRNLGAGLETWLRQNGKWIRGKRTLALDMVRLEWADIEAFDSAAEPTVHPEDLNSVSVPTLRLRLQPYLQLLQLRYPVDDLLLRIRGEDKDVDFASNAVTETRKTVRVRADTALRQQQIFLVVHQMDCSVYYRRVEPEAYALLSALRSGKTIDRALELVFRRSSMGEFDRGGYIRTCFRTWATLGWFCQPIGNNTRQEMSRRKEHQNHEQADCEIYTVA